MLEENSRSHSTLGVQSADVGGSTFGEQRLDDLARWERLWLFRPVAFSQAYDLLEEAAGEQDLERNWPPAWAATRRRRTRQSAGISPKKSRAGERGDGTAKESL